MNTDLDDIAYMKAALALARRGLGTTAPNPSVGCILVSAGGRILARGWTQAGGRPHAEVEALAHAGASARGATAYVTLEPCAHEGDTPSCARLLIEAGVRAAVVAIRDPDPRTAGKGMEMLRQAGIEIREGVCADEATTLNAGFLSRVQRERPLVTLKVASSLDGRIATHTGNSQWITCEAARAEGHMLRAQNDAILVGSNTAVLDNPSLTCRLPGMEARSPVRIAVDSRLRVPLTSNLVNSTQDVPTWLMTLPSAPKDRVRAYEQAGVKIIAVPETPDHEVDLRAGLSRLAEDGITRLLVEGGSRIAASLMGQGLVDRVHWFRAPMIIGGDGTPALAAFGVNTVAEAAKFQLTNVRKVGKNIAETYELTGASPKESEIS